MFIAKLGMKIFRGGKALINSLTHNSRVIRSASAHGKDTCGLALKNLGQDTVQISNSAKRWSGKPEQYIPDCSIANSYIPSHHYVEGNHTEVRRIKKILQKSEVKSRELGGLQTAVQLDNEFSRLTPLEKDCIAYRGVHRDTNEWRNEPFRVINNAKIGDIVVPDQGCGYAAQVIDLAEKYVRKEGMLYTIRIPKGARVSRNMEHAIHGGEVLMPRKAEYKLISKQLGPDGKMYVTLEYILPKSAIQEDIPQIKKIAEQYVNSTDEYSRNYAQEILEEIRKLEQLRT